MESSITTGRTGLPWYREPWPWLLAAGPIAAILAGIVTTYLAFASADGLVADDYYKRGMAINRELSRRQTALAHQLAARVRYDPVARRIEVRLESGSADFAPPSALGIQIIHPARAEADLRLVLPRLESGVYAAPLALPSEFRRRVALETPEWRFSGEWLDHRSDTLRLRAAAESAAASR